MEELKVHTSTVFTFLVAHIPISGFRGQARVILPTVSSCYECSLDMLTPRTAVPLCTLASIPRQPAHCVEWASVLQWPKEMGGKTSQFIYSRTGDLTKLWYRQET